MDSGAHACEALQISKLERFRGLVMMALAEQNCAQSMGLQNLSSPDEHSYLVSYLPAATTSSRMLWIEVGGGSTFNVGGSA